MAYLKPQSPIKNGDDYIYPLTTIDQVIMSDGSRLGGNGQLNIRPSDIGAADANIIPVVTASDNGKFLTVVNGVWTAEAIPSAEEGIF